MTRYIPQVYKAFVALITTTNVQPKALQLCCNGLRELLPKINPIHPSIVEAAVGLLRNSFYEVQYEGGELIKELIKLPDLQEPILTQMIQRLKTIVDHSHDDNKNRENWNENHIIKNDGLLASYTQQANCAKLLGVISVNSVDLTEKMIEMQCISGLLSAISNVSFPESQKYAADTLSVRAIWRFNCSI
jgi:hypothetical protein